MNTPSLLTDDAILADLGERLAATRLLLNLTQAELARSAGVSKRTIERMEAGHSTQTLSLVRVLRALDLLGGLEALVPPTGPSPIELLRREGKAPKRASGRRDTSSDEPWTWGDDEA